MSLGVGKSRGGAALSAVLMAILVFLVSSCSKSPQQESYEQAVELERQYQAMFIGQLNIGTLRQLEQAYIQVLLMDQGTKWATKAQARLDVIQTQRIALEAAHLRK